MDLLNKKLSNKLIFQWSQGDYDAGSWSRMAATTWFDLIYGGGSQFQTLAVLKTHFLLGMNVWVGVTLRDVWRTLARIDGAHMFVYFAHYMAHVTGASVRVPCCEAVFALQWVVIDSKLNTTECMYCSRLTAPQPRQGVSCAGAKAYRAWCSEMEMSPNKSW